MLKNRFLWFQCKKQTDPRFARQPISLLWQVTDHLETLSQEKIVLIKYVSILMPCESAMKTLGRQRPCEQTLVGTVLKTTDEGSATRSENQGSCQRSMKSRRVAKVWSG